MRLSGDARLSDRRVTEWFLREKARKEQKPDQTPVPPAIMPVITISREYGAGGSTIAEMLARQLGEGWQVWDRQVLNAVAESGQLRSDMAVVLDERTQTWIERMAANLLNVRTTDPTFYRQHLAQV
ncbi:MAG TPA: cytidylate kinase family protein, partial [Chthonomonadales bacterium]|nr:cytidylate kinase family protein [Chthonomonadales bacterium]